MTQTHDRTLSLIPARRRSTSAVPVLIQVPDLASSRASKRGGRRRLRREVRVAGYALLAVLPIAMVFACFGGDRPRPLAASSLAVAADTEPAASREVPTISLSIEPLAAASRDGDAPVSLRGVLLPAVPTEEDGDGRH